MKVSLSPKQGKIFTLVRTGLNNSQIAERLGNTSKAIEQHLVKIYRLLGVSGSGARQALKDFPIENIEVRTHPRGR